MRRPWVFAALGAVALTCVSAEGLRYGCAESGNCPSGQICRAADRLCYQPAELDAGQSDAGGGTDAATDPRPAAAIDPDGRFAFEPTPWQLQAIADNADAGSVRLTTDAGASWWRLSESGGVVQFFAGNSAREWTPIFSAPRSISVSNVRIVLGAD